MREEARDNIIQANADAKTARDNKKNKNYYASVFFSQQTAEKSLKALYLVKKSNYPEKTHNLIKLSLELNAPKEVVEASETLTPAAVLTRYSDVLGMPPVKYYTKEMAENSIKIAGVIVTWVKLQLK